ncbi:MAG: NAD(P)/FAD-dependent oxidoreductase [Sphingobacteriales bacterium]|nr:MAG: NAD(P)/FAD-dependent oxidoreductase [Sphingobacteriales bacterium]
MQKNNSFDMLILGGSYAGLSAALALGRSLRQVLILDSGTPCNRQTPHSHNFLTQDGETPAAIAQKARTQVLQYPTIQFHSGTASWGKKTAEGFEIGTEAGETFSTQKLIVATGIRDLLPPIPGFADCWGISVIHCPYCHGYEFRNCPTAIMANGERAFHLASLVRNLTDTLTIFTSGRSEFSPEQRARLSAHGIEIIETPLSEIVHQNGSIRKVIFEDGREQALEAMYAAVPFEQSSPIPEMMGCELTDSGHLKTDLFQKTTVTGIFACGDGASMMRSVANAVATGSMAGAMTHKELIDAHF